MEGKPKTQVLHCRGEGEGRGGGRDQGPDGHMLKHETKIKKKTANAWGLRSGKEEENKDVRQTRRAGCRRTRSGRRTNQKLEGVMDREADKKTPHVSQPYQNNPNVREFEPRKTLASKKGEGEKKQRK